MHVLILAACIGQFQTTTNPIVPPTGIIPWTYMAIGAHLGSNVWLERETATKWFIANIRDPYVLPTLIFYSLSSDPEASYRATLLLKEYLICARCHGTGKCPVCDGNKIILDAERQYWCYDCCERQNGQQIHGTSTGLCYICHGSGIFEDSGD